MVVLGYSIAALSGLCGAITSALTLSSGALDVFPGGEVYRVIDVGWGGLALSLIVIALALQGLLQRRRMPAYFLLVCGVSGIFVGGSAPIALCMAIAVAGGAMVTFGRTNEAGTSGGTA